jgi:hypothetical protein
VTSADPTLTAGTGTCTPSNSQIQVSSITTCAWTGAASDIVVLKFGSEFASFTEGNGLCSSILCVALGGTTNWLVLIGTIPSTPSISIPANLILNARYAITASIPALSYNGLVPVAITTLSATYTKAAMVMALVKDPSEGTLYTNVEHYHRVTITPITPVTELGFIQFTFTNIEVSPVPFCESSSLTAYDLRGILCNVTSATTIRVYNFQSLAASTAYTVVLRLIIKSSSAVAVSVTGTTFLSYAIAGS